MKIPFMNLNDILNPIYDEVMSKLKNLIDNSSFIGGEEIELFEKEFAEFCKTKYCVGCSNGTDAIFIALKVLGIGQGDTVLLPANTFIATAEAVSAAGANVAFIDIDKDYYTILPEKIEDFIKKNKKLNIKCIIPVHLYGQMADMVSIMEIAKKYNLKVVEDSAQAHGAELNGKRPGAYGDIATFSFYPGKNLGAFGDAGAIVMNDEEIYGKTKKLVDHGRWKKKYEHDIIGYNKRLDTIQAAILRIKLKNLEELTFLRNKKADKYMELLKNNNNVILPKVRDNARHVWHLFVIRVENREKIQKFLSENGISTGVHYPIPLHLQPAYKGNNIKNSDLKISEDFSSKILSLPFWPQISDEQINYVLDNLNNAIK